MRKTMEKLLAVLLAVCVLSAMLSLPAVSFADTWDGTTAASLSGEGTEESPYLIATGADLAYFAAQVNGGNGYSGKYIKLTDDIDLNNAAFTPIGSGSVSGSAVTIIGASNCFKGTFDGDGHTVSNLKVDTGETVSAGFFGAAWNATIKNLNVQGSVKGTKGSYALPVGGLLGCANNVTITNCSFNGTVESTNTNANSIAASGLVSTVTGGFLTINKCSVSGTVISFGRGGGILGDVNGNFTVNIMNSYCDATMTGAYEGYTGTAPTAGGLIGFLNNGTISVTNCFFYGTAPAKRASGMGGPVINHKAGGNLTLTRVYYNSDNNAPAEGGAFDVAVDGVGKTAEEFADGTVTALLNTNHEEPVFEQGENYPVFYVNKCVHENISEEWSKDATNHWHVCLDCNEKFEVTAHTASDWIIDTAATEESTGLKHKECTVCGFCLEEQVIPVYNPYAWDGTVSEFIAGEGTEESPYIIANGADLAYFTAQVNGGNDYSGKYIKVISDIDLNTELVEPIGNTAKYFRGTFDGDGHTISGLNISSDSANGIGFFGACHNATVKNINVKGNVTATASKVAVAGLMGVATGVTIKNCTFDGTIHASNNLVSNGAGGYTVNEQNNLSAAGLVCNVTGYLSVDRCVVSGTVDGFGRSGGLIGSVNGPFTAYVTNSYCDATVTGKGPVDESLSHLYTAGGLIGFLNNGTINLTNCFFVGTAPAPRANGMAGPVINHDASSGLICNNVYYLADQVTEPDGHIYGTHATAAEFADGTVTELLNGDSEEPIFEQGEAHPVFASKPCAHENTSEVKATVSTCCTQGHTAYTICDDCGKILTEYDVLPLDPDNHEGETEVRDAVDATCTAKGYTGDTYCLGCGEKIEDGEEIDFAAHTVGDWLTDETNHWHVCSECQNKVDEAAHTYEWVVTKEATEEENGLKEEICSVCGHKSGNSEPIEFVSHMAGDINGDKSVNNKDLTRLFQYLSDWDVEVDDSALDVNGDGSVNNKDLTRLFQYLSDWDVEIF